MAAQVERGQEIDWELNGGKILRTPHQFFGLILITISPIGAAMWYWNYARKLLPSLFRACKGELSLESLCSVGTFLRAHPPLVMGLIFPLVFLFAISLLSRTPRS